MACSVETEANRNRPLIAKGVKLYLLHFQWYHFASELHSWLIQYSPKQSDALLSPLH